MSIRPSDYLKDFKDKLEGTLTDSETKKTIIDSFGSIASSKAADASSQISSLGIGIGLAILGQYLAIKYRGSTAARFIARILGANVDAINRDFVLQKMKDKEYLATIREEILNVIETSSIDKFANARNLSSSEAWEVYRHIKDVVVDSEFIGMISRVYDETGDIETIISSEGQSVKTAIERQLKEVSRLQNQIYETNGLTWLPRNYFEDHVSTKEDIDNWKNGFAFHLPSIMHKQEFRRSALIDEIKRKLRSRHKLLLAGESGSSKSVILMEILTDFFTDGYEVLYNLDGAEIRNGK
jgi:hypothetical protein